MTETLYTRFPRAALAFAFSIPSSAFRVSGFRLGRPERSLTPTRTWSRDGRTFEFGRTVRRGAADG
jgi:hypothetical protein